MPTHQMHNAPNTIYFVTFTCFEWKPLFKIVGLYDHFNKWFEYLRRQDASLLGYVIMPNHFHGLIHLSEDSKISLNGLVGNGKRFMSYEIVNRLKAKKEWAILKCLSAGVSEKEKLKGKKHQVFRLSFDAKECFSRNMLETKLDYIHQNPVMGKWNLAEDWAHYLYSSAGFYELGSENKYVSHYMNFV